MDQGSLHNRPILLVVEQRRVEIERLANQIEGFGVVAGELEPAYQLDSLVAAEASPQEIEYRIDQAPGDVAANARPLMRARTEYRRESVHDFRRAAAMESWNP